jgi:sugar O-acyltransferase (sialic acid O-acetyltransferase NeuD family)
MRLAWAGDYLSLFRLRTPPVPLRYAIYGAEGCGRGAAPVARAQLGAKASIVFVDDNPALHGHSINDLPVISFADAVAQKRLFNVAVAMPSVRQRLVEKCAAAGLGFFSIVDPGHLRYADVDVGEGAQLLAHTMITANVRIGRHFHGNIYAYVEHDCEIGDFVTFGPRVNCNGRVIIEDGAYIGAGACLRQGLPGRPLRIGKNATIGMGAVVTRDVPAGDTVVGNPAKTLNRPSVLPKGAGARAKIS